MNILLAFFPLQTLKMILKVCELRLTIIKNQLNAMSNGAILLKCLTVHISSQVVCLSFAFWENAFCIDMSRCVIWKQKNDIQWQFQMQKMVLQIFCCLFLEFIYIIQSSHQQRKNLWYKFSLNQEIKLQFVHKATEEHTRRLRNTQCIHSM